MLGWVILPEISSQSFADPLLCKSRRILAQSGPVLAVLEFFCLLPGSTYGKYKFKKTHCNLLEFNNLFNDT